MTDERKSLDDFLGTQIDGEYTWVPINEEDFYIRLREVETMWLDEWTTGDRKTGEHHLNQLLKLKLDLHNYRKDTNYTVKYYRDINTKSISYTVHENA